MDTSRKIKVEQNKTEHMIFLKEVWRELEIVYAKMEEEQMLSDDLQRVFLTLRQTSVPEKTHRL